MAVLPPPPLPRLLAAGLTSFLFLCASTPAAELVVNGSFEQVVHDFPAGWSPSDNTGRIAYALDPGIDGERSLGLEILSAGHTAEVFQQNLTLEPGRRYTLIFKARGTDIPGGILKVKIGHKPGVQLHLDAAIPVTPEWRESRLEFTTREGAGAEPSTLAFSFGPAGRLWLDHVILQSDAPASAATEVPRFHPRLPPTTAKNLIPNASFEAGADGWLSLAKPLGYGGNVAGLYGDIVGNEAYDGARAYRLILGAGRSPESYFDCWPPQHVVQHRLLIANRGWIEVEPQRPYTLSAWMRADRPGTKAVLQLVFNGDAREPLQTLSHEVVLSDQWERHTFTVTAPHSSVFVAVGPDVSASPDVVTTFWADALQLEAGETASDFVAGDEVELGFNSGRYGNVFHAGEPVAFDVAARNDRATSAAITVTCRLTDYWDREVVAPSLSLTLPPRSTTKHHLPLDLPPGFYRAYFSWQDGQRRHERRATFAVIEPYAHQDSPFGLNHAPTTAEAARQLKQAGITWMRDWSVNWEWAEPQPGQLSFAPIDPHIERLRAEGLNILSLLPSNPSTNWASEAPESVPANVWHRLAYAPKDPELLYDFVEKASAHYRGSVQHWEFLNEPLWVPDFCLPRKGGYTVETYLKLLKGAAAAIKRGNPDAVVLGGLAIQSEMPFGDEFVKAGGFDYIDIFNLHPYAGKRRPESFIPDLERIRSVMDNYAARKPIWATEAAYYGIDEFPFLPWQPPVNHFAANLLLPSERHAGDFLIRFSTIMLAYGVEKFFWHEPLSGDANNGILDIENLFLGPGGLPRKSFTAVSALANVLGPSPVFAGRWLFPETVSDRSTRGIYGYTFASGSQSVLVAWAASDDGGPLPDRWTLLVPDGAVARDIVGGALPSGPVVLSESPVYIVSNTLTPGELARRSGLQTVP